jgi:hypothetical protein
VNPYRIAAPGPAVAIRREREPYYPAWCFYASTTLLGVSLFWVVLGFALLFAGVR